METNYRFHFFLRILSSGRLIVIKNLILPVEQIFRQVQIIFENRVGIFPMLLPLEATFLET